MLPQQKIYKSLVRSLKSFGAFLVLFAGMTGAARAVDLSEAAILVASDRFVGSIYEQTVILAAPLPQGGHLGFIVNRPTHVKLESTNGSAIELPVGMQMKKLEEGEWAVTARAESAQGSARPSTSSGASAGESSEILKRLMQRREQEGTAETTNTSDALPTGQERSEKAEQPEKTGPTSSGAADEVLRKLLQKREQEFNK